ncbi:MAG: hypothetical protein KDC05_10765 [Bacteroidales bacterium]|nr:hypothetical protein [Bacteroidales bacterium]
MESQFYQINLLQLFLRYKYHLGVIVVIAVILSAIFSGPAFITPKFESFAVVYPANIAPYSDENETEQMLQILQSRDIADSVIKNFNLAKHYEIDSTYEYFQSTMMWEYSQNVSISKTPYEGVRIEVRDKDAKIASQIVWEIVRLYNKKIRNLHEDKFWEVVEMYKRALTKKQFYLDSINQRLTELGQTYGLTDFSSQAEEATKGYLKTVDGSGAGVRDKEVSELKKNLENKGAELLALQNILENETQKYVDLKDEYERAYMDFDRNFTYVNMITKPYPADKKAYPIRWLIVVIAAIASFFIAYIAILVIENRKLVEKGK